MTSLTCYELLLATFLKTEAGPHCSSGLSSLCASTDESSASCADVDRDSDIEKVGMLMQQLLVPVGAD